MTTTCTLNCTDYTPDFTPGPTSCTLVSYAETRARSADVPNSGVLTTSVLFRAKNKGISGNDILVECKWYDSGDVETTDETLVDHYRIFINTNVETYGPYNQSSVYSAGPPPTTTWTADLNTMITDINNGSNLVQVYNDNTNDINGPHPAADHIAYFSMNLYGGTGGPTTPSSAIRTGPYDSLIYISSTETSNGTVSTSKVDGAQTTRHWTYTVDSINGSWEPFDPDAPKTCTSTCVVS